MRRRELFKAAAAGVAALAAPRIGRAERADNLVFVPTSDLTVLDPVVTGNRPTRNHAYLVFDTLYGIDTSWTAQPQMVEGHRVEEDGLIWTLTLRDGLRFHDKEPVLARDVVASIHRFALRISFAGALMAATEELSAPDDRTVRFQLKRPFPHLPEALAGPGANMPAIMPERVAATSPFKPVTEVVGSGPYRFLPDEHVSGARAAYERFALYQPRSDGTRGASRPDRRLPISIGSNGLHWIPFRRWQRCMPGRSIGGSCRQAIWWSNSPAIATSPSFPSTQPPSAYCASTICIHPLITQRCGELCLVRSTRPRQ
jgi:peptide/nickel transport system substrate-binding protein